jgi:hypothetical protein
MKDRYCAAKNIILTKSLYINCDDCGAFSCESAKIDSQTMTELVQEYKSKLRLKKLERILI